MLPNQEWSERSQEPRAGWRVAMASKPVPTSTVLLPTPRRLRLVRPVNMSARELAPVVSHPEMSRSVVPLAFLNMLARLTAPWTFQSAKAVRSPSLSQFSNVDSKVVTLETSQAPVAALARMVEMDSRFVQPRNMNAMLVTLPVVQ